MVDFRCQDCGVMVVDTMGDVCTGCQYDIMLEAVLDTAFHYREFPDNEALREELFDALCDYERWLEITVEIEDEGT